ncbi:MAG: GDP-L-fucose synthase [Acidobacteriia bacterium]|nr:GDP-L-fucose synthase [Terriglobia bacterium]MBV8907064.1 GDP-L-fucose synthase [Terriglobia bacterium]MBV9743475.1 GDP-L-fucose synthase [Terriglobia bacterium]
MEGRSVWVAGHSGMVGSALCRALAQRGIQLLTVSRRDCDLRDQAAVHAWVARNQPDAIFIAAAVVGGIEANRTRPVDFLYDNLLIAANVIHAAAAADTHKLMFLGSSCFYPRETEQPIREASLLTGPFEPTNEWYAVAKVAGVKLCQAYRRQFGKDFIAVVPTNLYGPGDHFDPAVGHVIPALMLRLHEAVVTGAHPVELWGTGAPRREFLYVDDAAAALLHLMEIYSSEEIINVAGGEDISIRELADLIAEVVGYTGGFRFDTSKPDGMPRKMLDDTRIRATDWRPMVSLKEGLARTYAWFLEHALTGSTAAG